MCVHINYKFPQNSLFTCSKVLVQTKRKNLLQILMIRTFLIVLLSIYVHSVPLSSQGKGIDHAKSNATTTDLVTDNKIGISTSEKSIVLWESSRDATNAIENASNPSNVTDMETSASGAQYRVHHASPEYRQRHSHHRGHQHKHVQPWNKPKGYQELAEDDPARKDDPDYGQHYDSDGHRYDFGYDVKDKEGALTFRKETGDAKSLKGSYGIRDVDGRLRIVRYVADQNGFRAKVETNEPGTGSEDAANVYFNGYDAEKIPSHDVLHKDQGQHSFKHGHYNAYHGVDGGLEGPVEESNHEESAKHHYHYDQIPMEINPQKEHRNTLIAVPVDGDGRDLNDGAASHDRLYRDYSYPHPRYRYVPPYRYSSDSFYPEYRSKKRMDEPVSKYRRWPQTYRIPYNVLTGLYENHDF